MASAYDEAVGTLYQAGLDSFVAERKRLAAELKSGGDKESAARLSKLARPPLSAWAVNRLWWQQHSTFEDFFASAERIRQGDLGASREHREALAELRAAAADLLGAAGHAATDATLRRVTITLSALAAAGGFEPDLPGALGADREPLGFDAVVLSASTAAAAPVPATPAVHRHAEPAQAQGVEGERDAERRQQERERAEAERRQRQERLEAERRRSEQARLDAERGRMERELAAAESAVERSAQNLTRLEHELAVAREALASARAAAAEARKKLAALGAHTRA